ncbi:MAG TPA: hypothetical protein VIM79_23830 [Niastella sp.]
MRFITGFIAFILFATTGHTQITMKGSEIPAFLDKMPRLPATVDEAYKALYPKTKKPPYQAYSDSLKAAIKALALEAAGKSYLLMAMADRLEQDNRKFDRIHNELPTDKELENKMHDINSSYFREADDLNRALGNALDSINKLNYAAIDRTLLQLEIYRKQIPLHIRKVKQLLNETNTYMNKRGYNTVLDNHDTSNKYYIQLLEVRGLMYDRIQKTLLQVTATWKYSADMADICKKHPESCK